MQTGTLVAQRYRIDAKLGEGGMGVVYKAHDTLLDRTVAIKTLSPHLLGAEGGRRFLREAQSAAKLTHPNIVAVFDVLEEAGSLAIVMELVEGSTLRELLPLPLARLSEITRQVLQGLEYAHAQGIVHRDIKPENIVVTAKGVAKLTDFGLARSEGRSRLTQTGLIVGTVAYLAPEQALGGQVDGRADLYSLGCVLYEVVTGHPPFESEDPISVITQHINVPPVAPRWLNPSVPSPLENVIVKLLAKDPARRYQNAAEVFSALDPERLGAAGTTATAVTAPARAPERIVRSPLVGRDAELAHLKELIQQVIAGRGSVVILTGPLGVGKTRLVEESITYARLSGVTVVSGKAYESAPPYEPFAKVLHELARGMDSESLDVALGEFSPEITALVPELARQLPRPVERPAGSAEDRKPRLFAGITRLLTTRAGQNPLLLFLDDMHLADAATVELLQHAARRAETSRLMLIVAYRPEDVPATPAGKLLAQVAHALSREDFCTTIVLRPLTEPQVVELIQRMASHPIPPVRFGRRIHEVTEGNPYFIEEVIKALFEQKTLYIKDGQWSTDFDDIKDYSLLQVPSSIQAAVDARLRTLRDETRQLLTHAAVIGRQFSFDTLLTVGGAEEGAVLEAIEEALRAQLIREVPGAEEDVYEFAQPMLRRVLYDAIPRRRRRLLHRKVGETMENVQRQKLEAVLEALVFHFDEAEDTEKVLSYARLAAEKATRLFAYDDAARYYQQAISAAEELDRPRERLELMDQLGDVLLTAARRDETVQAFEAAVQFWKSLPAAGKLDGARLYRKLGELSRWGYYNPRVREHIAEGLRLLEDAPQHVERVRLLIAKGFDQYWLRPEAAETDFAAAEKIAQEAFSLAQAIGAEPEMSAALDVLVGIYWQTAQFPKMVAVARQRVAIVEGLDDPVELSDAHFVLGRGYAWMGDYDEGLKHSERAYQEAARRGMILGLIHGAHDLAAVNLAWERWDEAERWCGVYDEIETRAGLRYPTRRRIIASRAELAGIRGNLDEARKMQDEYQDLPPGHPALSWWVHLDRVQIALAAGDHQEARAALQDSIRLATQEFAKLHVHTLALQFASQSNEWHYVEELGEEALARARRAEARKEVALISRALGAHRREHERLDEAEAFLREAEDLFRRLGCRWELGKTLREQALLRRGQARADEADGLLREALAHFEALGARPDVERTRALM